MYAQRHEQHERLGILRREYTFIVWSVEGKGLYPYNMLDPNPLPTFSKTYNNRRLHYTFDLTTIGVV